VTSIGSSPKRSIPLVFLAFVLLVMVVFSGINLHLLAKLRGELDAQLDVTLKGVATRVGRQIPWQTVSRFVKGDESSKEYRDLKTSLEELAHQLAILDLTVLDPSNRTLFSLSQLVGSENPVLILDEEELAAAWAGQARSTLVWRVGGAFLKRAYAPVFAPDGTVGAVVAVQTDVGFFRALGDLTNTFWAITALSFLAVGLLWLFFRRVLRYLLDVGESLSRADKLASIGKLAAMVTHEVRNPLGILSTAAQLALKRTKTLALGDAKLDELLTTILSEIERLNGIIERFLDLARTRERHREVVKLGALVTQTAEFARPEIGSAGGTLCVEVIDPQIDVEVDPHGVRQVLLNCLLNARDAVRDAPSKAETLRAGRGPGTGEFFLEVSDSGAGMDSGVLDRLYEPFLTTKETGAGIGLAVVKKIIEEHHGKIDVISSPGRGTTFTIVLPSSSRG
jgi:signal transduction histidine kinase